MREKVNTGSFIYYEPTWCQ